MPRLKSGSRELTQKQKAILGYVIEYIKEHNYPPSIREIGDHFGIKSTNGVFDHLNALARKSYITREYFTSRSIVVLRDPNGLPTVRSNEVNSVTVPYLGEAAGGTPILPFEEAFTYRVIDAGLLPKKAEKIYAVGIKGDSMIGDGIADGDTIFIQKVSTLKEGQIGIFRIDQEATVKHYSVEDGQVVLKASNKNHKPIRIEKNQDFKILGKVVGVFHSFN